MNKQKLFLSTLSLRRATDKKERLISDEVFLSTLSLRRATHPNRQQYQQQQHFYPRSPCGERPSQIGDSKQIVFISIHALLAESDAVSAVNAIISA